MQQEQSKKLSRADFGLQGVTPRGRADKGEGADASPASRTLGQQAQVQLCGMPLLVAMPPQGNCGQSISEQEKEFVGPHYTKQLYAKCICPHMCLCLASSSLELLSGLVSLTIWVSRTRPDCCIHIMGMDSKMWSTVPKKSATFNTACNRCRRAHRGMLLSLSTSSDTSCV
jgi:hypothetical protein